MTDYDNLDNHDHGDEADYLVVRFTSAEADYCGDLLDDDDYGNVDIMDNYVGRHANWDDCEQGPQGPTEWDEWCEIGSYDPATDILTITL